MHALTHAGPVVVASFLASLVECVEALTIVLAVGAVRGWRPALAGAGLGLAMLALLVAVLGPGLTLVPLAALQAAIGALLLLFGMRWLRKAVLRAGGAVPLRDEAASFVAEIATLRGGLVGARSWDFGGIVTSFQGVVLEGIEVVFIVIAVGAAGHALAPATLGAAGAAIAVALAGVVVHKPFTRIPENGLKFAVGIMLASFGSYWLGEGCGLAWPGSDLAVIGLAAGFAAAAFCGVFAVRLVRRAPDPTPAT